MTACLWAKTQQVINVTCTGSRNLSELSSSSVTLFFHWSKAKGNGNGGRLSSCLMVWEAASDWSKPYFSSTTHGGKRKLPEVAWSCTRLEEKLLITCCVFEKHVHTICESCENTLHWYENILKFGTSPSFQSLSSQFCGLGEGKQLKLSSLWLTADLASVPTLSFWQHLLHLGPRVATCSTRA